MSDHDVYETSLTDLAIPNLIASGTLSDECCEMYRQLVADNKAQSYDVFPPFNLFRININQPVKHASNDGIVNIEHGALVELLDDGCWKITGRIDCDTTGFPYVPAGVTAVRFIVTIRFNPTSRIFTFQAANLETTEQYDWLETISENWSSTVVGLCTLLLHRDVTIRTETLSRQRQRRGETQAPWHHIVVSTTRSVQSYANDVVKGRKIRKGSEVRAHLRNDRRGVKSIKVKSHHRGSDIPQTFYELKKLSPKQLSPPPVPLTC